MLSSLLRGKGLTASGQRDVRRGGADAVTSVPMQRRMKRMRKTWQTGTRARARAERILRRDLRRPKRRSTRRARMTRTMPVGSSVRTRERRDMHTTNMSSQHQGSETNGRNQLAKARITSSAVKMMVKERFRRSRTVPRLVEEPSGLVSSLAYCDSRMVQMKLCAQRNQDLC